MAGERILVVDDEDSMCEWLSALLGRDGYSVSTAQSAEEAIRLYSREPPEAVIMDIRMPGKSGLELLDEIKRLDPEVQAIMITAYATMESAIQALRGGASDYVLKPFRGEEIKTRLRNLLARRRLERENTDLKHQLAEKLEAPQIVGQSPSFQELMATVDKVASSDSTVLLLGESGTGKELVARYLHRRGPRSSGPFVSINSAALPEGLLESELFGHARGAFTGATKAKDGLFRTADGGTFFLDEVGETSPGIQVKLLRVLQEREIVPVGDTKAIPVDVRLISATNTDLETAAREGRFRLDLFYRLNVVPLRIPSLRERKEDIPLLVDFFLHRHCVRAGVRQKRLSSEAQAMFAAYAWPGNVRELENAIERMVILHDDEVLGPEAMPERIRGMEQPPGVITPGEVVSLRELEKSEIRKALALTAGNKVQTAKLLGIHVSTLYRKMDSYGIE
jgi:two-component system response regulator HydG